MATCNPNNLVFGVTAPKPLRDFPAGRARVRMRGDDFAIVTIRPPCGGARCFYVVDSPHCWRPGFERAANLVMPNSEATP